MAASEWQTLGIVLMALGIGLLVVSQVLLSWWHKKMTNEI